MRNKANVQYERSHSTKTDVMLGMQTEEKAMHEKKHCFNSHNALTKRGMVQVKDNGKLLHPLGVNNA